MWHLARSGLSWFLISDYTLWFRTSPLMMVPINFWWNSDLFKKKEHFSSSKTDKVRTFLDKSLKFSIENLSKAKDKSLRLITIKQYPRYEIFFVYILLFIWDFPRKGKWTPPPQNWPKLHSSTVVNWRPTGWMPKVSRGQEGPPGRVDQDSNPTLGPPVR